jgi:hypothetical protein
MPAERRPDPGAAPGRARGAGKARARPSPRTPATEPPLPGGRVCCLISEILEEAGLDRERARQLRRQVLQGVILFCQWQLERLEAGGRSPRGPAGARRVSVE